MFRLACQRGELSLSPIRGTLKSRIQRFLYLRRRSDLGILAPVGDGASRYTQILRE